MRASVVISAFVAVLVGFGGSVAIILAAARAVGATPDQTSSWVAVLCLSMMVTTAILSVSYRMPIVTAWSTPGAALLAASSGISLNAAVGAFFLAAMLIVLTAFIKPLGSLISRIPSSIASAMLAGVLFSFVIGIFDHVTDAPLLVLPLVLSFLVIRLVSPAWAVLVTLALGVGLVYALDLAAPVDSLTLSRIVWVAPEFQVATLLGLGIPLYLVTMASQNLPGLAVLRAAGYEPPTRSILAVTGLASFASAGFSAHTSNLAAITASICTGADAHPDPAKRWQCGPFYALGYGVLAIVGGSVATLFASFPEALVVTIAGIALAGPFVAALSAGLADKDEQFTAAVTFLVTASGISAFDLGSAFWGLLAGLSMLAINRLKRKFSS